MRLYAASGRPMAGSVPRPCTRKWPATIANRRSILTSTAWIAHRTRISPNSSIDGGIAAPAGEARDPDALFASALAETMLDLNAGLPLSFAVNKLVHRGLEEEEALQLAMMAAGGDVVHCGRCNLDYLAKMFACSHCGEKLAAAANDRMPPSDTQTCAAESYAADPGEPRGNA